MTTHVQQVAALADVGSLLDEHRVDYWLFGGWTPRDDPKEAEIDRKDFETLSRLVTNEATVAERGRTVGW